MCDHRGRPYVGTSNDGWIKPPIPRDPTDRRLNASGVDANGTSQFGRPQFASSSKSQAGVSGGNRRERLDG
jgi:hypothetical protein